MSIGTYYPSFLIFQYSSSGHANIKAVRWQNQLHCGEAKGGWKLKVGRLSFLFKDELPGVACSLISCVWIFILITLHCYKHRDAEDRYKMVLDLMRSKVLCSKQLPQYYLFQLRESDGLKVLLCLISVGPPPGTPLRTRDLTLTNSFVHIHLTSSYICFLASRV